MAERTYEERLRLALYEAAEILERVDALFYSDRVAAMRALGGEGQPIIGELAAVARPVGAEDSPAIRERLSLYEIAENLEKAGADPAQIARIRALAGEGPPIHRHPDDV